MQLTVKSKGMDEVAAKMEFLAKMGATITGIALHGATRKNGKTTAQIIEHLAEDNITDEMRDLRPTEHDSDKAAEVYMLHVEDRLRKLEGKGFKAGKNLMATVLAAQAAAARMANGAQAYALRQAGKKICEIMAERAENNMTVMGHTRSGAMEMSATPVSADYARWRENKFGVPASEVYKATGQLMKDLSPSGLRLTRGTTP